MFWPMSQILNWEGLQGLHSSNGWDYKDGREEKRYEKSRGKESDANVISVDIPYQTDMAQLSSAHVCSGGRPSKMESQVAKHNP